MVAATVLCAWSHTGRCRRESAFANLASVAPIPYIARQLYQHFEQPLDGL